MMLYFVLYQSGRRVRIPWRKWRIAIQAYQAGVQFYTEGRSGYETLPIIYPVIRRT